MGIQIINGGFLTTIQDMGRYGYQETGMSVSGVMDTRAASLANILVGNDTNEAVIEITMMGPTMKFTEDEIIAVTGGDLRGKDRRKTGGEIPCGPGKSGPDVELHGHVRRKPCVYRFCGRT